ncbi:MAG TPA: ACT domain-containing protein [Candidatus Nanoarchaeia archaeon]|nr:ACT domain-containing protein [Candidatus Nanoarchaeia archaeon]
MDINVKITVSEATRRIVDTYPYLKQFLTENCVNFSALSEKIQGNVSKLMGVQKASKQAILMSIIRYAQEIKAENFPQAVIKAVANSTLTLKTSIAYLNIPKTMDNLKALESLYHQIDWNKGEIFFIVQGIGEISVVVDSANIEHLLKVIDTRKVYWQFPSTAIVIMHSNEDAGAPGIINYLTSPVAKAGISIEMLTLTKDTIFLVEEKNAVTLFEILKGLTNSCQRMVGR